MVGSSIYCGKEYNHEHRLNIIVVIRSKNQLEVVVVVLVCVSATEVMLTNWAFDIGCVA